MTSIPGAVHEFGDMRTYTIKITDAQRKALLVAIDEARHCGFHDADDLRFVLGHLEEIADKHLPDGVINLTPREPRGWGII